MVHLRQTYRNRFVFCGDHLSPLAAPLMYGSKCVCTLVAMRFPVRDSRPPCIGVSSIHQNDVAVAAPMSAGVPAQNVLSPPLQLPSGCQNPLLAHASENGTTRPRVGVGEVLLTLRMFELALKNGKSLVPSTQSKVLHVRDRLSWSCRLILHFTPICACRPMPQRCTQEFF